MNMHPAWPASLFWRVGERVGMKRGSGRGLAGSSEEQVVGRGKG
jgi:hypothetical protein